MFLKLIFQSVVFFFPIVNLSESFLIWFSTYYNWCIHFCWKMYMPFFILRYMSHRKNFTYFLLFLLEVVLDVYLQPSSCSFVHSFGRVSLWLGLPGFSLCTRLAWVCSSAVGSVSRESVFATRRSLCILSGLLCWLSTRLPIISLTNVVCPLTDV